MARAAQGTPVASAFRRNRLNTAINELGRADFCLTPELSIPRAFALDVARDFASQGTSSILGLEYQLAGKTRIVNEVLICLADESGQYWLRRQEKTSPAHAEGIELGRAVGRRLRLNQPNSPKVIYQHKGVYFGILICSELLNSTHRVRFRGKVDLLFAPEWNRDVGMFDSVTAVTAGDVHCFVAQSNNREYGDSLVRGPYRQEWDRVAVRVRGGLKDHFMAGIIDVATLRRFQSQAVSPDDPFKPTPDGFKQARKRILLGAIKKSKKG